MRWGLRSRRSGKADGGAEPFPFPTSASVLYVLPHETSGTLKRRAVKTFNMMKELHVIDALLISQRRRRRARREGEGRPTSNSTFQACADSTSCASATQEFTI